MTKSIDIRRLSDAAKELSGYTPSKSSFATPPPNRVEPKIRQTIPGYTLEREIGYGGYGVVYLATHNLLGSKKAIKLLSQFSSAKPELRQRFLKEMKSIAILEHPNIVRATDARSDSGEMALVMDYVEGESLEKLDLPIDYEQACKIVNQVALALEHVHSKGVVHRDIKPSNVMIDSAGQAKLVDFGLALLSDVNSDLTAAGVYPGTPKFMAPEQFDSDAETTSAADIYGLGTIFLCLLTGDFQRGSVSSRKDLEAFLHDAAWIQESPGEIPSSVIDLIERMLSTSPEQRPTAAQVHKELEQVLAHDDGGDPIPPPPIPGFNKWLIVAALAVLLIATGAIGWIVNQELRVKTENGTLVINYDGEQNSVTVEQGQFTVQDQKTGEQHVVRFGENKLPIGDYDFAVKTSEGMEILTDEFKLSKNGEVFVRAKMELSAPVKTASVKPEQPKKTEHPSAEYDLANEILKLGGEFKVHGQPGPDAPINSTEQIPNRDFDIMLVIFSNKYRVNDESLKLLESADRIQGILAESTSISEPGLISFCQRFHRMKWLHVSRNPLSDASLQVIGKLHELEGLALSSTGVTDAGVSNLTQKTLESLYLNDCEAITDKSMGTISQLSGLDKLGLNHTAITDKGFARLGNLKRLKVLNVVGCNLSDSAIAKMKKQLPNCKILTKSKE